MPPKPASGTSTPTLSPSHKPVSSEGGGGGGKEAVDKVEDKEGTETEKKGGGEDASAGQSLL